MCWGVWGQRSGAGGLLVGEVGVRVWLYTPCVFFLACLYKCKALACESGGTRPVIMKIINGSSIITSLELARSRGRGRA